MTEVTTHVNHLLIDAQKALRQGNRQLARSLARQAAVLAPNREEPWLILAAIASPHASLAYLQRALEINPQSKAARQGMHWAIERWRSTQEVAPTPQKRQIVPPISSDALIRRRLAWQPLALLLVCFVVGFIFWIYNNSPSIVFARNQMVNGLPFPLNETWTPTFTETSLPSLTPSPSFTLTPTQTVSLTPSPSTTPTLTITPFPTDTLTITPSTTPSQTATLSATDTATLAPTATMTAKSVAKTQQALTAQAQEPIVAPSMGGVRWIDVNLSQQRLYAYEGDQVLVSFLVSTGTYLHPTVTGRFYIYVKHVYADMIGPDYYLPNVPYVMYFYKGYGLHGTYWHNNFGTPMSHGCVNLRTSDAQWLFNWASVGTLVNIHY